MKTRYYVCDACGYRTRLGWRFGSHRAAACPIRFPKRRDPRGRVSERLAKRRRIR